MVMVHRYFVSLFNLSVYSWPNLWPSLFQINEEKDVNLGNKMHPIDT